MKPANNTQEAAQRAADLTAALAHFTGSERVFKHWMMPRIRYTEGLQYLAEHAGAYWLLDKIVACQLLPELRDEPWQSWVLKKAGAKAAITVTDGNGRALYSEALEFTDFPFDEFKIYFIDAIVLLPSEY